MSTHPNTRPVRIVERRQRAQRDRIALGSPPDPDAWLSLLCVRCERPFKFQGIARHCVLCISAATGVGFVGSELIGEASGA